jgi:hypothetical protein
MAIQNSQLVSLTRALVPLLTRPNFTKVFGAYVLYILFKYRRSVPGTVPRTDLPGPWSIPLIGNLLQILTLPRNQVLQRQTLNHSLYGPIYAMTIPGIGRVINISEPDMVDHVLRANFWAYEKGPFLRSTLEPLVGGGMEQ